MERGKSRVLVLVVLVEVSAAGRRAQAQHFEMAGFAEAVIQDAARHGHWNDFTVRSCKTAVFVLFPASEMPSTAAARPRQGISFFMLNRCPFGCAAKVGTFEDLIANSYHQLQYEKMKMVAVKEMVFGKPSCLIRTFWLSYYTSLNLVSLVEGQFKADHVIWNSFDQFIYEKALPQMTQKITRLDNEATLLDSSGELHRLGVFDIHVAARDCHVEMDGARMISLDGMFHVGIEPQMKMGAIKEMVFGTPSCLIRTFWLSYYTSLNLVSLVEGQFEAEHVTRNSFHLFKYEKGMPEITQKITRLENEVTLLDSSGEEYTVKLHNMRELADINHFSLSRVKLWLIIILLFATAQSVSSFEIGKNHSNTCPARHLQFKRPVPYIDDWVTDTSEILLEEIEFECRVAEFHRTKCKSQSFYTQILLACGAAFAVVANLGPIVLVRRIGEVSSGRRRLLCLCSMTLLASNLSWVFHLGSNDCKNLFSYISLLIGFCCHGFFSWFFWQQRYLNWKCVASLIVAIVSIVLTITIGFIATLHLIRLGPDTIIGTNIISGIAGICGVVFNATSIWLRSISGGGRFDSVPFRLAICGALSALSSILSLNWMKDKTGQLTFKIGISILFGGRLYEMYQLWSYRHQSVATSTGNGLTAPLLMSQDASLQRQNENIENVMQPRTTLEIAEGGSVDDGLEDDKDTGPGNTENVENLASRRNMTETTKEGASVQGDDKTFQNVIHPTATAEIPGEDGPALGEKTCSTNGGSNKDGDGKGNENVIHPTATADTPGEDGSALGEKTCSANGESNKDGDGKA